MQESGCGVILGTANEQLSDYKSQDPLQTRRWGSKYGNKSISFTYSNQFSIQFWSQVILTRVSSEQSMQCL